MRPKEQLGVALVGAGWVAKEYLAAFRDDPRTVVRGVHSRTPVRAERMLADYGVSGRSYRSLDELLADDAVDIVVSCTPPDVRADHLCAAAEAGKHVVVEKPVALGMADLIAIRDAVATAGVRSVTSFVLRWHPQVRLIRERLAGGLLGDLLYAEAGYWHPLVDTVRVHDWRLTTPGVSAFVSGGCHAVDMVRFLGGEIVEVSAFAVADTVPLGGPVPPFPPVVTANLKFASGAVGSVSTLLAGGTPYVFSTRLVGSRGTVQDGRIHSVAGGDGFTDLPAPRPDSGDVAHHPFRDQVAHFLDCIDRDEESHAAVSDTWRSMAVCYAIDQSVAADGRPVRVALPD